MTAAPARSTLERRWLALTRETLPALADARDWPVAADHCFQRILLDAACDGIWYDHVARRPAYAHATDDLLTAAVALAEGAVAGTVDMAALDRRSCARRRARRAAA